MFKRVLPLIFLFLFTLLLFRPWWQNEKLPIPADTIVGLYHPWRDLYVKDFPSGVPFKNFLITDSVRQLYPWRELAMGYLRQGKMPSWNPYVLTGVPLAANIQSAPFYPLNILYLLGPFSQIWSLQVVLQILLGGIFMIMYLRNKNLKPEAISVGVLSWVGSGFFIAWLEHNTLVQAAIWLPLMLLCIDKKWFLLLVGAITFSFFAGAPQIFLYVIGMVVAYALWNKKLIWLLLPLGLAAILTFPQWSVTAQFGVNALRTVGIDAWKEPGWFLPWQNLAQFLAPDYFGNPATLNYFGVWNYMEFVGYIGIFPTILAIVNLISRKSKQEWFFIIVLLVCLAFSLPSVFSEIPYKLHLPLITVVQPTRLMVLINFSLSIMAAFGMQSLLSGKQRKSLIIAVLLLSLGFVALWFGANNPISTRNLYLPILLFSLAVLTLGLSIWRPKLIWVAILILVFDLFRFGNKFESFSSPSFLFPQTLITKYLQENIGNYRIAAIDDRIFPPNFSVHYKIPIISGYDSLLPKRSVELLNAIDKSSLSRIVVPKNYNSQIFDLLGVKYVLSLDPIKSDKLTLVFEEGQTKVYENKKVLPRSFFIKRVFIAGDPQSAIERLFSSDFNAWEEAVTEGIFKTTQFSIGSAEINEYSPSEVIVNTSNSGDGLLVLTDTYYPGWVVSIDGVDAKINVVDYALRGVIVPAGQHKVRFSI